MKIVECKQGTTEWQMARLGLPTASEFDRLVTPLWKIKDGDGPQTHVLEKVAERVMGYAPESVNTFSMGQGSLLEHEAIPLLEGVYDLKVDKVGFCTTDDGRIGCSPDGLIGDEGGIEVKAPEAHTHLKYLLGGVVPKDYVAQVQGCLYVTGRKWWKFMSYNRHFPPLVVHVEPDPAAQSAIKVALERFLREYDAAYEKLQAMLASSGRGRGE